MYLVVTFPSYSLGLLHTWYNLFSGFFISLFVNKYWLWQTLTSPTTTALWLICAVRINIISFYKIVWYCVWWIYISVYNTVLVKLFSLKGMEFHSLGFCLILVWIREHQSLYFSKFCLIRMPFFILFPKRLLSLMMSCNKQICDDL